MPATLRARPWAPFPDGPAPFPGERRRVGHRSGGAPVRTGPAAPQQTRWGGRAPGGSGADAEADESGELAADCLGTHGIHGITTSMRLLVHTSTRSMMTPPARPWTAPPKRAPRRRT